MEISYDNEKKVLVATFPHASGGAAEFSGAVTTSYS